MTEETPNAEATSGRGMRAGWAAAIAGIVLAACLCGFAAGSILISAGVSAYSGWSGVAVTRLVVTVAFVSGPTYTPLPTYTLQPTYTPEPTYTLAPTPPPIVVTIPPGIPTQSIPTDAPVLIPTGDVVYEVEEGDTLETIVEQFGADIVPIIVANRLDPDTPTVQAGDTITIPFGIAPLCLPPHEPIEGEVIGVFDGDTIEVTIGGQNYTVRYLGIDAPALEPDPEPFSSDAQIENQALVDGVIVSLYDDISQTDASNRLLRYVVAGDTFVNYDLVRRGLARAASSPPDTACDQLFALAENQANLEGLGIWATNAEGQPASTPGATQPAALTPIGTIAPSPTPTATIQPAAWQPPPSSTPTATSSLGFNCQCRGKYVWGNFQNQAQADVCASICAIAATRRATICDPFSDNMLGCNP